MAGIWDMITGQNPNQGAINSAQNSANQAAQGQNQLIQNALLPIYNSMLSSWNQYYAPLQSPMSNEMQGLAGGNALGPLSQIDTLTSIDPSLRDALTGVPLSGMSDELMQYFMNPGGTLSGLNGVGGEALSQYLDPNTNLAQVTPGVESYFGNPQNTNLAGLTPGAESFFGNEAVHGLSPQTIGSAVNTMDTQTQQQINSMRNSLGAGVPNIAGLAEDMNLQGLQSKAGLLSGLAGQNQAVQQQGVEGMLGAGQGLDAQSAQMLGLLPGLASGLDEQSMQRMAAALQTSGGIDQMTQQMLGQAYNIGNQQSGQGMNYFGQGLNTQQGILGDLFNFLGQGRNILPGAASGIGNIANLYGNAASGAANNAMNLANAGNAQNQQMFGGLANLAGQFAGAGMFG